MKVCSRCQEAKSYADFHKEARAKDGLRSRCKSCVSHHMRGYYADNREDKAAGMRAHRKANPDSIRASEKARYERHKDARIALAIEGVHIRRSRILAGRYDKGITTIALQKIHGSNCCYCNVALDFKRGKRGNINPSRATIEHVLPISRGGTHTWDNAALACHRCNVTKQAKTLAEWKPSAA